MVQYRWSEAEMILAADLADSRGWKGPNSATPEVVQLSELLKMARIHPKHDRPQSFRSPGSVSLKVNNLIGSHPDAPKKPLRTSAAEVPIDARFVEDRVTMEERAAEIREQIKRGEL